jgi:pimeloyl-ACP methyl ester carboxylesterase
MQVSERVIQSNGIEIATEAFGDPANPTVLLVMGAMASMLWWPEEFCQELAARGRYVIRYDNRDTGLSTKYEPGEPPYTLDDMADDAVRILDGYGISAAHLVGMSMGGVISQLAALKHPERVASLTAISTSPVGVDTSNLPQTSEAYRKHAAEGENVDWSDRSQVIEFMVKDSRMIAGTAHPYDEAYARRLIARDVDRARNFVSATNHFMLKGGDKWQGRLHAMQAPLLVIHGSADPIFPVEHGVALSQAVAGARLVKLEGGGHELHRADWDEIIMTIVEHTDAK